MPTRFHVSCSLIHFKLHIGSIAHQVSCKIRQGLPALHQNITSSRWFLLVMKAIVLIKQYDTKQYDVEQYDIF